MWLRVSKVYFDMKLVTGHIFKMLGNAGLSKIALPQVAAAARVKTSGMRDDTSSECDTFSLTN